MFTHEFTACMAAASHAKNNSEKNHHPCIYLGIYYDMKEIIYVHNVGLPWSVWSKHAKREDALMPFGSQVCVLGHGLEGQDTFIFLG